MKSGEARVQVQRVHTAGPAITNSPAHTHISPWETEEGVEGAS